MSSQDVGTVLGVVRGTAGDTSNSSEAPARGACALGKVLDGVRFAAPSGPGPSGMQLEHLKNALSTRMGASPLSSGWR